MIITKNIPNDIMIINKVKDILRGYLTDKVHDERKSFLESYKKTKRVILSNYLQCVRIIFNDANSYEYVLGNCSIMSLLNIDAEQIEFNKDDLGYLFNENDVLMPLSDLIYNSKLITNNISYHNKILITGYADIYHEYELSINTLNIDYFNQELFTFYETLNKNILVFYDDKLIAIESHGCTHYYYTPILNVEYYKIMARAYDDGFFHGQNMSMTDTLYFKDFDKKDWSDFY